MDVDSGFIHIVMWPIRSLGSSGRQSCSNDTQWTADLIGMNDPSLTLCAGREGKHADFVILSRHPLEYGPGEPLPTVLQTYVDGVCMYGCA